MPSPDHELLVSMLRDAPAIVVALLREHGLAPPAAATPEPVHAALADPLPELRPDLVLAFRDDKREIKLVTVVEVQLRRDDDKPFVWPLYEAMARKIHRAPTRLLVIATEDAVARWARAPIDLAGRGGSRCHPLVVGPKDLPAEIPDDAPFELIVLNAIMRSRGRKPDRAAAIAQAIGALERFHDDTRSPIYIDFLRAKIGDEFSRALETTMAYQLQSDWAKQHFADGEAKGKAEGEAKGKAEGEAKALLAILAARGLTPDDAARARIAACTDLPTLERWITRAATADAIEQVFAEPAVTRSST